MDPTSPSKFNNTFSLTKLRENQKVRMHFLAIPHLDTPGQEIVEHIPRIHDYTSVLHANSNKWDGPQAGKAPLSSLLHKNLKTLFCKTPAEHSIVLFCWRRLNVWRCATRGSELIWAVPPPSNGKQSREWGLPMPTAIEGADICHDLDTLLYADWKTACREQRGVCLAPLILTISR